MPTTDGHALYRDVATSFAARAASSVYGDMLHLHASLNTHIIDVCMVLLAAAFIAAQGTYCPKKALPQHIDIVEVGDKCSRGRHFFFVYPFME
jgi:hypothetical protein